MHHQIIVKLLFWSVGILNDDSPHAHTKCAGLSLIFRLEFTTIQVEC